ncbi:MAG: metal-dependent hydrolase [Cyanobacteria bacterium P01_A01_bin.135]
MASITVRRAAFNFSTDTQRYWLGGDPFQTHLMNSFTLAIPLIEHWAIRIMQRLLPQIDGEVRQDAIAFVSQEVHHAHAHNLFWENLDRQGYTAARYRQAIAFVLGQFETRFSLAFNCAILAGLEHLTEYISDFSLSHDIFSAAEPELRYMFEWHAAEEIEHKTVVYDVINNLGVSYPVRLLALLVSHIYAIAVFVWGTAMLLRQDRLLRRRATWGSAAQFLLLSGFLAGAVKNFAAYLKPNFHPSQRNNMAIAQAVLGTVSAQR